MAKQKKFSPILGDLSKMTPEAQNEYVLAICEFLDVPPELGLIGLSWMDSGDGARNLTPYVRRGATDIIRNRRGIDIDSLVESNGSGYVGWIVRGHDNTGRHEMAVGAVSTDGIKGRAIADAVKTSQTQALRRMTLQFAGGGFLDESEIHEKTSSLSNSAAALELLPRAPAPTVTPNVEAGKDITPCGPKDFPSNMIANMKAEVEAAVVEETSKKKRPGRKRKTVSLDSPSTPPSAPEPAVLAVAAPPKPDIEAPSALRVETAVTPPVAASVPLIATPVVREAPAEVPSDGGEIPTKEQEEEFRNRLSKYINEILPPAGFLQSEKYGTRNNKMKLFMKAMFPKANLKMISVGQWKYLLTFLDDHAKISVEELVKTINRQIGEETA